MNLVDLIMSQLLSFVVLGLVVAGVFKLFQVSTDLGEIKEILSHMKRMGADNPLLPRQSASASPADLIRAVNAEGLDDAELYARTLLKPPNS